MKLPNVEKAFVPQAKITEYLLSFTHRDGRSKAAFFTRFGFTAQAWQTLADALICHAEENEVAKASATPFGVRCVIEGRLTAPDGRRPMFASSGSSQQKIQRRIWLRLTLCE